MPKPRVLVVDDEPRMRSLIRMYLRAEYDVAEAPDGASALQILSAAEPDLILLDVTMPGLDGWETLARIREESNVPVIMLTARGDVPARVQALRTGADDYVVKPFDGRELAARILAVLRRTGTVTAAQATIRRGGLVIHTQARLGTWKNQPLTLTPKEFDLLVFLASNPDQVFSREKLLDRVWSRDADSDIRTVDTHVKNLRRALGDGAALITTIWGVGYRFTGDEPGRLNAQKRAGTMA